MKGLGATIILLVLGACSPQQDALSVSADAAVSSSVAEPAVELFDAGIWSASGILLRDRPAFSPDGRFILQWTDDGIRVSGDANGALAKREMGGAPPEILWSPGGAYVAITWSDDSPVPVWSVDVYYLGDGTPHDIGVGSSLRLPDDAALARASERPEYNYGAIAWLDNESELLLVSEQPLSRSWMNGTLLVAMTVSLPDVTIGAEFDGATLLDTNHQDLGPRLLRDLGR
jgi:hypothetical protein